MKIIVPDYYSLLKGVPKEDQPEKMEDFYSALAYEVFNLLSYAKDAVEPQIVFNEMRKAGDQYIWEFYVNELSRPKENSYNFHGQNTSQWLYAGCILLQNRKVSTHH
jgi:hypothetical protein